MASISELEQAIRSTLAAAEDATDADRPWLMAQVDTLTRERDELVMAGEPDGYTIGSDGQVVEVRGGAADLDGI